MSVKNQSRPSGPTQVGSYTVTIDRDMCIGAATCAAIAAQTFNLDDDAKAIILSSAGKDDDTTVLEAAKACPVSAIMLTDSSGSQVFP